MRYKAMIGWAVLALCLSTPAVIAQEEDASVKAIRTLVTDPNPAVRCQALRQLARLNRDQAIPLVVESLDREVDVDVLATAVMLAGDFRDDRAVASIVKVFQKKVKDDGPSTGLANDADTKIRDLEEALKKAKKPEDQRKITEDIKDVQKAREARKSAQVRLQSVYLLAIEALGKIGSADASAKLMEMVDSPNPSVRCCAVAALGNIKDPAIRESLTKSLANGTPTGRMCTVQALDMMDDLSRPGSEDSWVQRAVACMVVQDIENSDKNVAGTAMQWVLDLGAGDYPALSLVARIQSYRDLLRANDADNKFLVDFELISWYLRHKAIRRCMKSIPPKAPDKPESIPSK